MRSGNSCSSALLFFIFINLIQIKEKTHMPVTVYFPGYAFNENIYIYCFHKWDVFLIYLFLWHTQKLSNKSLLRVLSKKEVVQFSVKCYALCVINSAGKLICLFACLQNATVRVSLTSLIEVNSPLKFWLKPYFLLLDFRFSLAFWVVISVIYFALMTLGKCLLDSLLDSFYWSLALQFSSIKARLSESQFIFSLARDYFQ